MAARESPNRLRKKPREVLADFVKANLTTNPGLHLRFVFWRNPTANVWDLWEKGADLVEIGQHVPVETDPDFRPIEFPALGVKWPPLRLWLTSPEELRLGSRNGAEFVTKLRAELRRCRKKEAVLYSDFQSDAELSEWLWGAGGAVLAT